MDYSPWSSKNLMDYNWLKKFMQVGIDIIIDTCTLVLVGMASLVSEILPLSNFGQIFLLDHDLSVFRDFAPPRLPLKTANTSFSNFCKSHMWLWIQERWHPTSDNNQHKHPLYCNYTCPIQQVHPNLQSVHTQRRIQLALPWGHAPKNSEFPN